MMYRMTRSTLSLWFALTLAWLIAPPVQAEPTSAIDAPRVAKDRALKVPDDEALRKLDQQARRELSEVRMSLAMRVVAGWALLLFVGVACFRGDEWTGGHYTRWLWTAGATLLLTVALVLGWFL
jgi:hypothetical protein